MFDFDDAKSDVKKRMEDYAKKVEEKEGKRYKIRVHLSKKQEEQPQMTAPSLFGKKRPFPEDEPFGGKSY